MRAFAYLLLVLSSTAVAGKVAPVGAPEATPLRGHVLVWHDAKLFAAPDESARSIQLATFEASRAARVGHVVPMRVVSSAKGGFVEVELAGDEDCTWSRTVVPDDLARVRLFVRRADLAPVLVKPFAKSFDDGTSIELAAGTPVVPTEAGTAIASLHGDELEVDVPAASIGYAYTPGKLKANLSGGQTVAIAAAAKGMLGDRTLSLTAWKGAPVERRGAKTIVALEGRCTLAHVSIATNALTETDDESTFEIGGGGGGTVMGLRDEYYLPKLTPLAIGTHTVAVAAKPIYLHAAPSTTTACIQRAIRIDSALDIQRTEDKLRLCAPATKVKRELSRS
jgi:hypothetical protein